MKNLSFALMLITFFHLNPVNGQVLENQVLALTKELKKEGYILTHSVISGSLDDEEEENKYFDLEEGGLIEYIQFVMKIVLISTFVCMTIMKTISNVMKPPLINHLLK